MNKRIIAKIIDTIFVATILALPVSSYIFAINAIEVAYNQTVNMVVYLPLVLLIFLTLFIYFGVIGKKVGGSVAKGFMNLEITGEKINAFKLFIREPLTHVLFLTIVYLLVFNSVIISLVLMCMIYFVALLLRVDLWNRIFNNEVLEKGSRKWVVKDFI